MLLLSAYSWAQRLLCVLAAGVLIDSAEGQPTQVFILAGQSNLVGSANVQLSTFPQDQPTVIPEIQYTQNVGLPFGTEGFGPLQPRLTTNGAIRRWVGVELTFGSTLLDAGLEDIAIIKFGRNGTSLAEDWAADGQVRSDFNDFVDNAFAELQSDGQEVELAGFVWVQGSGDGSIETRAQDYDENLAGLVSDVEDRYGETTTIINRYHTNSARPFTDTLRESQRKAADADADLFVVNTDDLGLNPDWIHFTDATDLEVGRRLANRFLTTLGVEGDYNEDGQVNVADYAVWRDSIGSLSELSADGDGDGVVDVDDYNFWVGNFGRSTAFPISVPEPSAFALTGVLVVLVSAKRRR